MKTPIIFEITEQLRQKDYLYEYTISLCDAHNFQWKAQMYEETISLWLWKANVLPRT